MLKTTKILISLTVSVLLFGSLESTLMARSLDFIRFTCPEIADGEYMPMSRKFTTRKIWGVDGQKILRRAKSMDVEDVQGGVYTNSAALYYFDGAKIVKDSDGKPVNVECSYKKRGNVITRFLRIHPKSRNAPERINSTLTTAGHDSCRFPSRGLRGNVTSCSKGTGKCVVVCTKNKPKKIRRRSV